MTLQNSFEQHPSDHRETFQEQLGQLHLQNQAIDSGLWQKARAKAWDHFLNLGLPTQKNDIYKYIRLRRLFELSFIPSVTSELTFSEISKYVYPESSDSVLVFINGHYQPTLSRTSALPANFIVSTLSEATKTYGTFLSNQWSKSIQSEQDPFATLNAALHRDGAFLYLPPKCNVTAPIQILNVIDQKSASMLMFPRLHLFVGAQSQISLISSLAPLSGSTYCLNQSVEMSIEEDAHVRYLQTSYGAPSEMWHFDALRASLKRNSTLKTMHATDGCAMGRHDYRVTLLGENAEASLNGMLMLSDKREAHHHILMDHQAPHCRSTQLYKSVLNDFSRSSFEGKILVRQLAQKTEAFQLNNNLLLSDRAHADSKPNLEIFADDVKASHGATVGQLDPEQLFYMKARGFHEADAKNLLVYSFCKEVIDLFSIPSLHQEITEHAKSYMVKI